MKARLKSKLKEIGIRAAKTFLQAFLAAIPFTASTIEGGVSVWKSVLVGAVAAGLSAAMNVVIAALSDDFL